MQLAIRDHTYTFKHPLVKHIDFVTPRWSPQHPLYIVKRINNIISIQIQCANTEALWTLRPLSVNI